MSGVEGALADLVSAGTLGIGLVAGLGAMTVQGADGAGALKFAGVTMVGATLGDAVLTWAKIDTRIESFMPNSSYVDPLDFVSAGASVGLLSWYLGLQGDQLLQAVAVAAVAGGIGRKVGGMLMPSGWNHPRVAKHGPKYAPGPVLQQGGHYAPGPLMHKMDGRTSLFGR